MPRYTFTCDRCQEELEFIARMSQAPSLSATCPVCGLPMRRVYARVPVQVSKSAADVLNQACAGEGDPCPGMTHEQTRQAALSLAESVKDGGPGNRDVYKRSRPVVSYPDHWTDVSG